MTSAREKDATPNGGAIVRASSWGTATFAAAAVAGVIVPHPLGWVAFAVSLGLFVTGCVVFVWAFALAVGRSRTDDISVVNLFLLSGNVPATVRTPLLGSLIVEIVVAVGTAAVRPYTIAAAAILAPVYALALCGLWAARHGAFPPRKPPEPRRQGGRRR
ncbi:MAG: hypothetical protein JWP02_2455 [Acidimicrobiales bacterium]|nr:hypothetical protein [Acidimicrobiales bacterium]